MDMKRQRRLGSRTARLGAVIPMVLALCGGLLAACGSSEADGLTRVTVGVAGTIFDAPLRVADAKGYFRAAGLKVEFVTLTSSLDAAALQSDSVQFLNYSPTTFINAVNRKIPQLAVSVDGAGSPLGLIVSTKFARAHHLTADTPPAEVARALRGSVGGASSATTQGQAGIFLREYGVSPNTVRYASLPSPAADKAALSNNRIDWFVTSEPTPLAVQDDGDGVVVAGPDTVPAWSVPRSGYGQIIAVRQDYATTNAELVRRFVRAVQQGSAYIRGHESDVVSIVKQTFSTIADPVLLASLRQVDWPETGAMSADGWKTSMNFIKQTGAVPKGAKLPRGNWTNEYLPR
ncbi:ABC transporter substrate-binding protein [Nocardia miyunensis]|uniref:ABC transporter substrate-binding protein n=1 Tax=Nocardia miyunensis TaxID=282684 RepID=UPI000A7B9D32|nr:ABC transporter substrate-binding protein [Nocardia miyunensis]